MIWLLIFACSVHAGGFFYKNTPEGNSPEGDAPVDDSCTVIQARQLIPGAGPPITNASLVWFNVNGTIAYVGPTSTIPSNLVISTKYTLPVIMPGMWDVHTHYGGTTCSALADSANFGKDLAAGYSPNKFRDMGCALAMLRETICAGVTSVRELGGIYGQAFRSLTESGLVVAPHFYYASKAIGMTGGHTDQQFLPPEITRRDYNAEWDGFGAICDGVAECVKKVREQLRARSDVVKIMTTGGVLSAFDQPTDQEFSMEEVEAMVEEASRAGRSVAAHAHGAAGIAVAITAGVHTLEHGSYLTSTLAQQAKSAGMIYVPTITIQQTFNQTTRPPTYDPAQWAKGQEVVKHASEAVRIALAAGLTIATGTDCPGDCAQAGQEALYLNTLFGMTPLQAIKSATANGPSTLGVRAPKSGQLVVGYDADVIAFNTSPLDQFALLADADAVTHVFKAGRIIKSPDNGACTGAVTHPKDLKWAEQDL